MGILSQKIKNKIKISEIEGLNYMLKEEVLVYLKKVINKGREWNSHCLLHPKKKKVK